MEHISDILARLGPIPEPERSGDEGGPFFVRMESRDRAESDNQETRGDDDHPGLPLGWEGIGPVL